MRGLLALIAAFPWRLGAIVFFVIITIPFSKVYLWAPYPLSTFMSEHPNMSFAEVPRWYGPGAWAALLVFVACAFLSFMKAQTPTPGFKEILAVACYSIISCWDLYMKSHTLLDSQGDLNYANIVPCAAANMAVSFCSGVLQAYAVALLAYWVVTDHRPSRINIAKFSFIFFASYFPTFAIWQDGSGIRAVKCNQPDELCSWGRWKLQNLVFFVQLFSEMIGECKDAAFSMYPFRIAGNIHEDSNLILFAVVALFPTAIFLFMSKLAWKMRIPVALLLFVASFWATPLFVLWIGPFLFLFIIPYPLLCAFMILPTFFFAAIPGSAAFPDSTISILEVDQAAVFIAAIAFGVMTTKKQFMPVNSEKSDDGESDRLPEQIDMSKRWMVYRNSPV
ncbi:hypothetical protein DL96DRAFT_273055 [Flagelloscypha sp. PMI_526]|nr:hypothetical protein DL96DRAFT_273055 [Flagelloscypha sp. PMI_526]